MKAKPPLWMSAFATFSGMLGAFQLAEAGDAGADTGPDIIVGKINGVMRWAGDGEKTAYSVGTTACNVGSAPLLWEVTSNLHPVIGQNMFRLSADGRFEHIGQSWLKHGFCALQGDLCASPELPCEYESGCLQLLRSGCSDPYSAPRNGYQGGLGPKWQVNAFTGVFEIPPDEGEGTGNPFQRRLVVNNNDLDPALNPGAKYFVEAQYVTQDDSAAGNQWNNVAYRAVTVGPPPSFTLTLSGSTSEMTEALRAWQDVDPGVDLVDLDIPGDGRVVLGYKVTDLGNGTWHYEYALYNMNCHESVRLFIVPIGGGSTVSNLGFHDVDYHSGDGPGGVNYDGTDWSSYVAVDFLVWYTDTFAADPSANALRWGTLYNFRFDASSPPQPASATIGLYRTPSVYISFPLMAPAASCVGDLNEDGKVDAADLAVVLSEWGPNPGSPADINGDGEVSAWDLAVLLNNWSSCP